MEIISIPAYWELVKIDTMEFYAAKRETHANRSSEMAQWEKPFTNKPDNLS